MSTILVRQAGLPDLDALVPLFDYYRQFYGRSTDLAAARAFLLARIAQTDGVPIGFAQLYPSYSSASLARVFILNDLFVDAHFRR